MLTRREFIKLAMALLPANWLVQSGGLEKAFPEPERLPANAEEVWVPLFATHALFPRSFFAQLVMDDEKRVCLAFDDLVEETAYWEFFCPTLSRISTLSILADGDATFSCRIAYFEIDEDTPLDEETVVAEIQIQTREGLTQASLPCEIPPSSLMRVCLSRLPDDALQGDCKVMFAALSGHVIPTRGRRTGSRGRWL